MLFADVAGMIEVSSYVYFCVVVVVVVFLFFFFCVVFFFQAEDGIRDLVRSRGLGDVYKRQAPATWPPSSMPLRPCRITRTPKRTSRGIRPGRWPPARCRPRACRS